MRRGFTILELLTASLLLSLMVTILAMVFNQSSIAWRTGTAGVVELADTRSSLGAFHDIEDDVLPGLGQTPAQPVTSRGLDFRTVSIFRNWNGSGAPNPTGTGRMCDVVGSSWPYQTVGDPVAKGQSFTVDNGRLRTRSAYVVGVRSWGPDRKEGTSDDISTLPEEGKQ